MYDLYPYFTNDGTVGLFSRQDDDIYHSTYGALTESWQKFIQPCHLKEYIKSHKEVKILDICYGIGYNTKTALNVFIENAQEEENLLKNKNENNIEKNFINISEDSVEDTSDIAAIDTNNVIDEFEENYTGIFKTFGRNSSQDYGAIDSDNVLRPKNSDEVNYEEKNVRNTFTSQADSSQTEIRKKILIDAVDMDRVLIGLSPFVRTKPKLFLWLSRKFSKRGGKSKFFQIYKIQNSKLIKLKKEQKLKEEVSILLLMKLIEGKFQFNEKILQTLLTQKKYAPFLSKFMLNFSRFYQNWGYNYNKKLKKSTFLHNIYYKYLSRSYKNVQKLLFNNKIDLNFHHMDARSFVQDTDNKYNFIFLDAFTPAKCPALWTADFMRYLYALLEDDGMILTYSNSAAIRNAFVQNGFVLGKVYDEALNKFVGTIAVKNSSLIEYPLDDYDIGLINSRAGICFRDPNLDFDNQTIISNRMVDVESSSLISSSKFLKGYKN